VRYVLVDLRNDAEGWVPLEVKYPASAGPMEYVTIKRHPELSSPLEHVARVRGARLAHQLQLKYIAHHL
jgi:hypothetical protein